MDIANKRNGPGLGFRGADEPGPSYSGMPTWRGHPIINRYPIPNVPTLAPSLVAEDFYSTRTPLNFVASVFLVGRFRSKPPHFAALGPCGRPACSNRRPMAQARAAPLVVRISESFVGRSHHLSAARAAGYVGKTECLIVHPTAAR